MVQLFGISREDLANFSWTQPSSSALLLLTNVAPFKKEIILQKFLDGFAKIQIYFFLSPGSESSETQEDVYVASVETDRGVKEQLRLYDTKGLHDGHDLPKHYYTVADGFVLVYSVDSLESFKKLDVLKKEIDKSRDKKEVRQVQSLKSELQRIFHNCLLF